MRIGGKEVGCRRTNICEVAASAARNQDLSPRFRRMVYQQDAASALPGNGGAKHPGCAGANNDRIELTGGGHRERLARLKGYSKGQEDLNPSASRLSYLAISA